MRLRPQPGTCSVAGYCHWWMLKYNAIFGVVAATTVNWWKSCAALWVPHDGAARRHEGRGRAMTAIKLTGARLLALRGETP
ncbi:hypothetical protein BH10ACT9_BH10ACT9_58130 [soil metagenome]